MATMGMATNASFLLGQDLAIQDAMTALCKLRDAHQSLWDLPADDVDPSVMFLKAMVRQLVTPACEWVSGTIIIISSIYLYL